MRSGIERGVASSLDAWSENAWTDGLQIDRLSELDELAVRTRNSTYRIIVTAPTRGEVLIQGGRFFPELTRAHLLGCSLGGSFLKQRGIYLGFRMEIHADRDTVVTSDVRLIAKHPCTPDTTGATLHN